VESIILTFLLMMSVFMMICTIGAEDKTTKKCIAAEFIAIMSVLVVFIAVILTRIRP
jgi:hypothetical protein